MQVFDAVAAPGLDDCLTQHFALKTIWVMGWLAQQIVAVLPPIWKEVLHADSAIFERHALLDVVGELAVVNHEEVEGIVDLDQLLVGLEEHVAVPLAAKMPH